MIWLAGVPMLLGVISSRIGPSIALRMRPAAAAVLLTGLALTVSLVTGLVLCVAGCLAVAEVVPGLRPHDWGLASLRRSVPMPPAVGLVAGSVGAALLLWAIVHLMQLALSVRQTVAMAHALPNVDGLAIIDDDERHAYAVPGRHGVIVISTGLLRALSSPQRQALLEHERTHLRHRHYLYSQLAGLAAAANPLMRPIARAVDAALERWADAAAARAVGDPSVVAHAIGAAALSASSLPSRALGAAGSAVVERVRYLLEPPPRRSYGAGLVIAAAAMCWVCAVEVMLHVHGAIEIAEATTWR